MKKNKIVEGEGLLAQIERNAATKPPVKITTKNILRSFEELAEWSNNKKK